MIRHLKNLNSKQESGGYNLLSLNRPRDTCLDKVFNRVFESTGTVSDYANLHLHHEGTVISWLCGICIKFCINYTLLNVSLILCR